MKALRRLTLLVSIVASGLVAFAVTPQASGMLLAQGLLAAGNYHITTQRADYFTCCGDPSQPSFSVDITDTTTTSNPLVGSSTMTQETDVFVNACGGPNFICGGGCFIPDNASDFTLSSDLQSAALDTTVTPDTKSCQGFPVTLPTPFTINVTWTGVGPLGSGRNLSTYACGAYSSETQTFFASNTTTATGSTSLFTGSFPATGSGVGTSDQRSHAQGIALDSCPLLGAKGAGPGPQAPGNHSFASQSASVNIIPSDPSLPQLFLNAVRFTNVSQPTGTAPSTDSETNVNIFSFSPFNFVADCFVIPSGEFTIASGLSSASLHAVIDTNTPVCQGFTNSPLPFPLTIDITWTGTGPVASLRTVTTSNCGSFSLDATGTQSTNPASVTGNVSSLSGPFTSDQAGLDTNDHRIRILGSAPKSCNIHG